MEKIAIFDFCGTIANFQTFDPFMKYIIRQRFPIRYRLLNLQSFERVCQVLSRILRKCGVPCHLYKSVLVRQIRGIREVELRQYGREYYESVVRQNLIPETLEFLKKCQRSGYRIMIVSGGSELYISWFADEFGITDVITTELKFQDGVCCGRLGLECLGKNKIAAMNMYMKEHGIQGSLELGVTDSATDQLMLENCQRKVIVSWDKHQNWVTGDMEEIIWK